MTKNKKKHERIGRNKTQKIFWWQCHQVSNFDLMLEPRIYKKNTTKNE